MGRRALIALAAVLVYLAPGIWFAYALKTSIPAVSWPGAAYVAATWPTWLKGSPVKLPIPFWCFSFDGGTHDL